MLKATSQLFYFLGFHSRDLDMLGLKLHSTTDTVAVKDRCDVTLWLVLKWGDKPERRPPRTGPQTHWCSGSWALSVNRLTKQQSEISKAATTQSVWVPSGRKRDSTKKLRRPELHLQPLKANLYFFFFFLHLSAVKPHWSHWSGVSVSCLLVVTWFSSGSSRPDVWVVFSSPAINAPVLRTRSDFGLGESEERLGRLCVFTVRWWWWWWW